jgi:thiamine-monophosphate kinase
MKSKNTAALCESGLIDMIRNRFAAKTRSCRVTADIGDDCFCFKSGKENICVTKDMLIEDVHFKTDWISAFELGQKAIEVNISDIASMGAVKPEYVFIGLGCPRGLSAAYAEKLFAGFKKSCGKYGAVIAGGDTVKSDKLVISVTVIGSGAKSIVKRSGAENGDFIGVTNTFGDSAAGLALLTKYGAAHKFDKRQKWLISRHNAPCARLGEAAKIAKYATSMTDSSDGLYISAALLTKESRKGANIYAERIPVSKQLKMYEPDFVKQTKLALYGGEDFELVFTVHASKAAAVKKAIPSVTYIGIINNSKKVKYFYNGKEEKTKYCGFSHF